MAYAASALKLPVQVAPELRRHLNAQWRGEYGMSAPLSMRQQVHRAVQALLPTGDCCLGTVARMVDLHPRVLQQRLKAEHTRFSAILRDARERLACEHLSRSDIRLTDLALHLGYSELSVFSRSFSRWTGMSPQAWRQQRKQSSLLRS